MGEFVRRLSAMGMEINLPGDVAPPAGTLLELDLRLEDGASLIVGTGEVTAGGRPGSAFRVRFLELTPESRKGLGELVSAVAARTVEPPAPTAGEGQGAKSLEDLVVEAYGERRRASASGASDAVLVPPEEALGAPAERRRAPARGSAPAPPRSGPRSSRRSGVLGRLGVSPGVVAVAIIAGATGAAAHAWFNDVAAFFLEVSGEPGSGGSTVIDFQPQVSPSEFGAEPAPAGTEAQAAAAPPPEQGSAVSAPAPGALETGAAPAGAPAGDLPDDPPANRVRLITWEEGPEETVVTFRGNGPFLADRIEHVRVPGAHPREVIKLLGIDLPYRETFIALGSPEIRRIRTGFHPEDRINELHVVLDLAGSGVRLERMEHGRRTLHLRVRSDVPEPDGVDGPAGPAGPGG